MTTEMIKIEMTKRLKSLNYKNIENMTEEEIFEEFCWEEDIDVNKLNFLIKTNKYTFNELVEKGKNIEYIFQIWEDKESRNNGFCIELCNEFGYLEDAIYEAEIIYYKQLEYEGGCLEILDKDFNVYGHLSPDGIEFY